MTGFIFFFAAVLSIGTTSAQHDFQQFYECKDRPRIEDVTYLKNYNTLYATLRCSSLSTGVVENQLIFSDYQKGILLHTRIILERILSFYKVSPQENKILMRAGKELYIEDETGDAFEEIGRVLRIKKR